jgi:CRISPR-associated Cas5-like protein
MGKLLKIDFAGWTATPRDPIVKIGTINTLLTPTYSMLIGLIECCVGQTIDVTGLMLGFWYSYERDYADLETTHRLKRDPNSGRLEKNEDDSVTKRMGHVAPTLSLFINRLEYKPYFYAPVGIPCLGQSQDLIWIEKITEIEGELSDTGKLTSGLVLLQDALVAGEVIRCVDAYIERNIGLGRAFRKQDTFIACNGSLQEIKSKRKNIFHSEQMSSDVYLYEFC